MTNESQKRPPFITHVAIVLGDEIISLPRPCRHHHIIHTVGVTLAAFGLRAVRGVDGKSQGFLDETGAYLDRVQAKERAIATGQLLPTAANFPELYSEDVW